MIYLVKHKDGFGFDFKLRSFAIDKQVLKNLSKLGLPLTIQTTAINISMLYVTAGVNTYGLIYSSVFGIGNKVQSLMFIITNSITTACSTMFGQNLGAGKHDRVKKTFLFGMLYCMVFFLAVMVLCLGLPEQIFRLFTQDVDVIAQAAPYMVSLVVMFLGFATMTPSLALVNGTGNGGLSLIIALADGVVARIGLSLILADVLGMGVWGYFWGTALAGFVSTIMGGIYYFTGAWKKRKLMIS